MGEVYRARDTRLRRDVALKILPASLAADREALARFEREATTLASLNHPHIAHVYGIEDTGSTRAIVMELVEGQDLAERIRRGPLALDETLAIARQLTDALAAAHQAGIVHRDLKPANIRLTREGGVKVLDFGLAKPATDDPEIKAARPSPDAVTLTLPHVTHAGVILGTAPYMAPEQASGRMLDRRVDIWAFGCVVFEMLVGRRAFGGGSMTEILASVLTREPDWTSLPPRTPENIRRLLRRCLEKAPRKRLHDIADARLELDEPPGLPAAPVKPRRWPLYALAVSAALLAASAVTLVRVWPAGTPGTTVVRPQQLTDMVGLEEAPAISPDGRSVAFTADVQGKRQVFVQLLDGGSPLRITKEQKDHELPRWTPASSSVVYFSPAASGGTQGALWEVPTLGGAPRRLVDSLGGGDVRAADSRLAFFRLGEGVIQLVTSPLDGTSRSVVAQFKPGLYYRYPRWSPDGQWIAYQRGQSLQWELFVVPAAGGEPRQLTRDGREINGLSWLGDGSGIVFSSTRTNTTLYLPTARLWQVAIADGAVTPVTSGEVSYSQPDVATGGAVVAARLRRTSDIWTFPTGGTPAANMSRAVRITRQTAQVLTPTESPDGREIAFLSDRGGHANVWVLSRDSGELRQITHERNADVTVGVPVWSPRGDRIVFVTSRGTTAIGTLATWIVNPDGSSLRHLVDGVSPLWSQDGRFLYYTDITPSAVFKIDVESGATATVREDRVRNTIGAAGNTLYFLVERSLVDGTPAFEIQVASPENGPTRVLARIDPSRIPTWQTCSPTLSPDGRWIAQALTDGFSTNIWAVSTDTGEWRQITAFDGRPTFIARRVSWSADAQSVVAAVAEGDADVVLLEGLLPSPR